MAKYVFFFLFMIVNTHANLINIAVNSLQPQNIKSEEAEVVTDRLAHELIRTKTFRIIERNKLELAMQEHTIQSSGLCGEDCQLELGKVMGVQYFVLGSVGKIGIFNTINIRIMEVQSGEIIHTVNVEHHGPIGELLFKTQEVASDINNFIQEKHNLNIKEPELVSNTKETPDTDPKPETDIDLKKIAIIGLSVVLGIFTLLLIAS
ncbi:MAG: hypothetical protein GX801_06365 [Fibrobacter sp.]|nr:hypothetical protein [Fibrobacter sp.]